MEKKLIISGMLICLTTLLISFGAGQAFAALGGSVDSIASDQKVLKAAKSSEITTANYSVHEFQSGVTTIREYVSSSGIVFGIAWNGLTNPDLSRLLGSYADEHKKAASRFRRQPGHRYAKIKSANVVVERWGHMRNMQGRAYAPALIPQGVSVDEIK